MNRADVFHVQDGAVREQRIGEGYHHVIRLTGRIKLDVNACQLGEADGKIVVRTRVVGVPA